MSSIYYRINTTTLKGLKNYTKVTGLSESLPAFGVSDDHDTHFILHETLEAIADAVRERTGDTELIPVDELAEEVLEAYSFRVTPSVLGVAVLGRTLLGYTPAVSQLAAPVIRLVTDGDTTQLATPVIKLVDQLETPIIELMEE